MPASNEIQVSVTNTPANAHGSAQASGLLGPVVLRPRQGVTVRLERQGDGGGLAGPVRGAPDP